MRQSLSSSGACLISCDVTTTSLCTIGEQGVSVATPTGRWRSRAWEWRGNGSLQGENKTMARLVSSSGWAQDRRQKVFSRGVLRLCRGGLALEIFIELHWFIVFHISIWRGAWSFVWGDKPTKAHPRSDGTAWVWAEKARHALKCATAQYHCAQLRSAIPDHLRSEISF